MTGGCKWLPSVVFTSSGYAKILCTLSIQVLMVWKPLMKILTQPNTSVESLEVASSILYILLLKFSPTRGSILEARAVDLLCSLTNKFNPSVCLNSIWGLMYMVFSRK